jgi:hypothetical protein
VKTVRGNKVCKEVDEQGVSVISLHYVYCHAFGVCVTNTPGFDLTVKFIGPLCNWLQSSQITI